MSDWWTYSLDHFLLFSPRVYDRLFVAQNAAWWPLPLLSFAAGLALVGALLRRRRWTDALAGILVAAATAFVAVTFLRGLYAPVNPIAGYAAWGFFVEAALVGALAFRHAAADATSGTRGDPRRAVAVLLALYAALGLPAATWSADVSWRSVQVIGMAPDPTAVMTLAWLVAATSGWFRALASIVPVAWCGHSALVLAALDRPLQATMMALAALVASLPLPGRVSARR